MENVKESQIEKEFTEIKIENIKRFIDTKLDNLGVYNKIKNYVEEVDGNEDEEHLMNKIKEAGLIEEILECFKSQESGKSEIDKSKKCLYFKIVQGKGFVDYININKFDKNDQENYYFQFDILFLGQRFVSKKVMSSGEFTVDQSFILEFNPLKLDIEIDLERMKKLSCPIHVVIILINGDEKKLVATKSIEWRWALCYGSWKIEAEMYSPDTLNKLNVGVIEVNILK